MSSNTRFPGFKPTPDTIRPDPDRAGSRPDDDVVNRGGDHAGRTQSTPPDFGYAVPKPVAPDLDRAGYAPDTNLGD